MELILVDVKERRLVGATSNAKYIALSYVWGNVGGLETNVGNYEELQKQGSVSPSDENVPRVIRDAMEMVSQLQERYLWVDRLCLVQDSVAKHEGIQQMNRIYDHALLTIFAIAGKDATHGLPGVFPTVRNTQMIQEVQGVQCVSKLPELEDVLASSVHITRGWTFQEHLLSTRRLFVSDRQVYFQCLNDLWCESSIMKKKTARSNHNSTHLDRSADRKGLDWAHYRLIQSYTQRRLTFDGDILRAFTGVTSAIQSVSGIEDQKFIAGLSVHGISHGLLWLSENEPVRRRTGKTRHYEMYFPSWSWAGWKGPVNYRLIRLWNLLDEHTGLLIDLYRVQTVQSTEGIPSPPSQGKRSVHEHCSIGVCRAESPRDTTSTANDVLPGIPSRRKTSPTILQFWAQTAPTKATSLDSREDDIPGLPLRQILDADGRKCGVIFGAEPPDLDEILSDCLWILLSHFELPSSDNDASHYYKKYLFGSEYLSSATWCGCVPFLMLVYCHYGIWERVAIGSIHPEAWEEFRPGWEYTRLG